MSVTAPITNISRGSLHDGPGVRTVVYFKGCGLRCAWCHNPETLFAGKQILYAASKCIHCGRCVALCPAHHLVRKNEMVFLREGCTACGKCAEACPSQALTACLEEKTVDELWEDVRKDSHYFAVSGGGVTFSGGECLLHAEFVAQLAKKCKESGIATAVESAFFVPWENVESVLPQIDLFFADLKIPDPEKHRVYTGKDNHLILANIRKLSQRHDNVILRIPVIPGVNDAEEDILGFGRIIRSFGSGIRGVELLRYNYLAESKYDQLGKPYVRFADNKQTDGEMEALCAGLGEITGLNCYFV